jgi:2-oxoglutarate dehydrogenase complex dehydrogenase (E1) component-like enzyme
MKLITKLEYITTIAKRLEQYENDLTRYELEQSELNNIFFGNEFHTDRIKKTKEIINRLKGLYNSKIETLKQL